MSAPPRKTPQQVAAAKAAEKAARDAAAKSGQQPQQQIKANEGVLGKIEGEDWHRPPEEGELPPYKEAAMQAWEKAKEAGAGKFRPGGLDDGEDYHDRLRAPLDNKKEQQQEPVPPPVRSVLTFGANSSMALSSGIKASPGIQGGLFYKNRSFCFSAGYRDGIRGMDPDDKGNFLKMKDPLGLQRLSVVFFGHLVWLLHKEGRIDMFAPICTILPELKDRKFDGLFPRDILNFSCGMDDAEILKLLGINSRKVNFDRRYHDQVTLPLNEMFSPRGINNPLPSRPKGSENEAPPKFGACGPSAAEDDAVTAVKMGMLMRQNLVTRLGESSSKLPKMIKRRNPRPSHFAMSLLCAAIERKMSEPMEEIFRKKLTEPLGIMSVGFGIPQILYRSSMFWQPTGLPHTHFGLKDHLPPGDARHSSSPLFNPSLNLFGNPEDTAKLLCDCFGSAREAVEKLPRSAMTGQNYYELGWMYVPHKKRFFCKTQWGNGMLRTKSPVEYTPYAAAAMYDDERDAGAFCVTNCGSAKAQLLANFAPQCIAHLFIKQCIDTGMDLLPTDESGHVIQPPSDPAAAAAASQKGGSKKPRNSIYDDDDNSSSSSKTGHSVNYTNEGKEYRASTKTVAASGESVANMSKEKLMSLSKEEQIAQMKKLSEEQKEAADKVTNSWFGRAQGFFKTGSLNSEGYKRF